MTGIIDLTTNLVFDTRLNLPLTECKALTDAIALRSITLKVNAIFNCKELYQSILSAMLKRFASDVSALKVRKGDYVLPERLHLQIPICKFHVINKSDSIELCHINLLTLNISSLKLSTMIVYL